VVSDAREAFEIFYTVLGCKIEEQVWNSFVWRSFRTAWYIQQKRIDELEEKLNNQDMQLACERMDSARFIAGQEDGVRGAVMRWNQALTEPYPKSGVMSPILEKPYRQTEELRRRIDELEAEVKMLTAEVNEGEYDMPY